MLEVYPVVVEIPVRWADMDALGHVTNSVYPVYFETVRIVYVERMGLVPPRLDRWDYGFILASNSYRYRAPVEYPDTLRTGARVTALGDDRFSMEYLAFSLAQERVVAEGEALVVSYDYANGRRASLRAEHRAAIIAIEGHEPPALPPRSGRDTSSE